MKKLFLLMFMCFMLVPIGARAQEPSPELAQNGTRIAFLPIVTSFVPQKSSMIICLDTVESVHLFQVQYSDRPDFKDAETRYFRNVDNHGSLRIVMQPVKEDGKTYNTRTIWYGGVKIEYRKALRKHSKDRLTTPQSIVDKLRNRLRMKKRLYVPGKGKHVRIRCIYYGGFDYAYSKWVTVR